MSNNTLQEWREDSRWAEDSIDDLAKRARMNPEKLQEICDDLSELAEKAKEAPEPTRYEMDGMILRLLAKVEALKT